MNKTKAVPETKERRRKKREKLAVAIDEIHLNEEDMQNIKGLTNEENETNQDVLSDVDIAELSEIDESISVVDIPENSRICQAQLNSFVDLLAFYFNIFNTAYGSFYQTDLLIITRQVIKYKNILGEEEFANYMTVFLKIAVREELNENISEPVEFNQIKIEYLKNLNSVTNFYTEKPKDDINLLMYLIVEVYNANNYNKVEYEIKNMYELIKEYDGTVVETEDDASVSVVENHILKDTVIKKESEPKMVIGFKTADLKFIKDFHGLFGMAFYQSEFVDDLKTFVTNDFRHVYVIKHILPETVFLEQSLMADYKINMNPLFLTEYGAVGIVNSEVNRMLANINKGNNMDEFKRMLYLLEYGINRGVFMDAFLVFCYFIKTHENVAAAISEEITNIYYLLIQNISDSRKLIRMILVDIGDYFGGDADESVINLISEADKAMLNKRLVVFNDLINNYTILKTIKNDGEKLYSKKQEDTEVQINKVLNILLGNMLKEKKNNTQSALSTEVVKNTLKIYYFLSSNGVRIYTAEPEQIVEAFNRNIDIVKYSLYMLGTDYIISNLMSYYKIILNEINFQGIFTESKKNEFYNKLIEAGPTAISGDENYIHMWNDAFDGMVALDVDTALFYQRSVQYLVTCAIRHTNILYRGKMLVFNDNFTQLEFYEGGPELGANAVNTPSEKNAITRHYTPQEVAETATGPEKTKVALSSIHSHYCIGIRLSKFASQMADFAYRTFSHNPEEFSRAVPADISLLPFFCCLDPTFKSRLFRFLIPRLNSYLLFVLYDDFNFTTGNQMVSVQKTRFQKRLSEIEIIALLRLNLKRIDSGLFSVALAGMEKVFTLSTFKMAYSVVLNNPGTFNKFRDFLFRQMRRNVDLYRAIYAIVNYSRNKVMDEEEEAILKEIIGGSKAEDGSHSGGSKSIVAAVVDEIFFYHKNSFEFYGPRRRLAIAFTEAVMADFQGEKFFTFMLEEKREILKGLSSYVDYAKTIDTLTRGVDNTLFSYGTAYKIFCIRRLGFLVYTSRRVHDARAVDKIVSCVFDLFNTGMDIKIELYRLIRILLWKVDERQISLLYPIVKEDMELNIGRCSLRYKFVMLSCMDVALFMDLNEWEFDGILAAISEPNSFKADLVDLDESPYYNSLFDYKTNTNDGLVKYAGDAIGYYQKMRLIGRTRNEADLEQKLLLQFKEKSSGEK